MSGAATIRHDTRVFDAGMDALERRGVDRAGRAAMVSVGLGFVSFLETHAPRDTNRFIRGYIQAWNSIPGVTPRPLPPLEESSFVQGIEWGLYRDLRYAENVRRGAQRKLEKLRARTERIGEREWDKRVRRAERELDRAGDLEDRAIENLAAWERAEANNEPGFAIVFARARGKRGSRTALSRVSRVFTADRLFGGTADLFKVGGTWVLRFANREPHARLVERRSRVLRRAVAAARATGARRASGAAQKELIEEWRASVAAAEALTAAGTAGAIAGGRAAA